MTHDEWLAMAEERFGPLARNWRMKCPVCGKEYTLGECGQNAEEAGRGLSSCIGRINGKGGTAFGSEKPNEFGCNFVADGLFRSPWVVVVEGKETRVIPFAEVAAETSKHQ